MENDLGRHRMLISGLHTHLSINVHALHIRKNMVMHISIPYTQIKLLDPTSIWI